MNDKPKVDKKRVAIGLIKIVGYILSAFVLGYLIYTFIHA